MIEKTNRIIVLYDFYQELLTEKQRLYFESYYEDDCSFAEVAEKFEVSRNAVHDNLKRAVTSLEEYEEKLHLLEKYNKKVELLEEYRKTKDESILQKIEEL